MFLFFFYLVALNDAKYPYFQICSPQTLIGCCSFYIWCPCCFCLTFWGEIFPSATLRLRKEMYEPSFCLLGAGDVRFCGIVFVGAIFVFHVIP